MISLPLKPKVIKQEGQKAVFEIEGLYPGYGVTIGNALRRVLISSLEGASITQVKIKGVQHEFSTIPGVMEGVITIILNLKALRFKIFSDEPQKIFLKVKGEKEIKGSDIKIPPQLELVNGDCHIATLTSKSTELEMEMLVEKGIGYRPREARKKHEKLEIGTIPLDAIFSPVKRVGIKVENMRVGERTDYDRLFIEIETDNTISPEHAFSKAAEILVNHFLPLSEAFIREQEEKKVEIGENLSEKKKKSVTKKSLKHAKEKKRKKVK